MRRHARQARAVRREQASNRERREHAVRVDDVEAAAGQHGAQPGDFPERRRRHVAHHRRLDGVHVHAGDRAGIASGGEEMDRVAARGKGTGEAGHLPFNAAAARRTPVGDEAD